MKTVIDAFYSSLDRIGKDVRPVNVTVHMLTLSTKGNALLWNGITILAIDSFSTFYLKFFFPMLHVDD